MLELRLADIFWQQETGFGGKSVGMINGKAGHYKLFQAGNDTCLGKVRFFLTEKWIASY